MILVYFLTAIILSGLIYIQKECKTIHILATMFMLAQFVFLAYTIINRNTTDVRFFTYDTLGILFFAVLALLAASTLYYSINYLDEETLKQNSIYFISFILLCASITGAYFSNNVTLSWILIEATTLSAAMLIYHRRTSRSLEAAWKYVLVCSIGIALAYLGILFLSIMLKGQHELNLSYENLSLAAQTANPLHLKIAFLLILIGYSAKMEVFPLYSIGIDANHAVPTPMSGFFSTALVNLGFISIFRIFKVLSVSEVAAWSQNVLLISGIISVLIATIYLLKVKHYKRLFAYSTVENMGIVLIAMSLGKAGCFIAIFHILTHSFIKSTSYYSLSRIGKIYKGYRMELLGGYWNVSPLASVALLLCMVGLIAVPPSALFISELMLFKQLLLNNNWIVFIVIAFLLCFAIYALLTKIMHICYFSELNAPDKINRAEQNKIYLQFLIIGIFFFLGIYQPEFLKSLIAEII